MPDARALSTRRLKENASPRSSKKPKAAGSAPGSAAAADPRTRKLGEVIAYAIKRDIAQQGWPVGRVMGNQAELMQRYGVSRSTLREAVRQIERHGVARMRRGAGGGLVVQQPARDSAVFAVVSYLELAAVRLPELFEAREMVESLMIGLACERATEVDVRRVKAMLDELLANPVDDIEREAAQHLALRGAISALARNPAVTLLLEALYRVTSDMLTVLPDDPALPELTRESRREKRELIEPILANDEVSARIALRNTLQRSREMVEAELQPLGLEFEQCSALALGSGAKPSGSGVMLPKLGHRISLLIARDVAVSGAAAGSRLGPEPEVRERYGVSRAVFREALRTLELHSIVRLRRGYGGGLEVGEADPSYTVELASIYFQYARLKPRHFYEVWRALQITSAQLAASRITDAGREQLAAVIAAQKNAKREHIHEVHGRLHLEISRLSGNRVLRLFTLIMSDIAAYYPTEFPPPETWKIFLSSHIELAEAVSRGDVALARRLMTRHMKLVDAWYGNPERESWLRAQKKEPPLPAA